MIGITPGPGDYKSTNTFDGKQYSFHRLNQSYNKLK